MPYTQLYHVKGACVDATGHKIQDTVGRAGEVVKVKDRVKGFRRGKWKGSCGVTPTGWVVYALAFSPLPLQVRVVT